MSKKTKLLIFNLNEGEYEKVKQLAEEEEISMSEFMRRRIFSSLPLCENLIKKTYRILKDAEN